MADDVDFGFTAARDAGGSAKVQLSGVHFKLGQAAHPTAARVGTGQLQSQRPIAADHAVIDPGIACAEKRRRRQQLPGGGLCEVLNVDVERAGLNHAAVGPAVSIQGQVTARGEVAAGVHYIAAGQTKVAFAGMHDAATSVQQTAGREADIVVCRLQHAALVIQPPTNLEAGDASVAECAQFAGLVVDAGRCDR